MKLIKKQQNININNGLTIVLTFFFLWIAVFFDVQAEAVLAYFFIFTFGILHGSNDLKLIQQSTRYAKKTFFIRILLSYVGVVLFTALFFSWFPELALVLFVMASSYHFGEQHWVAHKIQSPLATPYYTFYGMVIFFLLFYTNEQEVTPIIDQVTGITMQHAYYLYTLVFSFIGFIGIYLWLYFTKKLVVNMFKELFFLLVFYIVFTTASLLWAFSIYFVVWHSVPSLIDQTKYLYGSFNKATLLKYVKTSCVYWLVSMIGLAILYYFFQDREGLFLSIMIYFLAAITFPHVIVMTRLNRR
jgi:Brp/Blh family beta-carotene 15,15'-monooxygenase